LESGVFLAAMMVLLGIPLNPVFAGVVLRHQLLQIELDQQFKNTLIGGSNGLTLTLGVL
jgi:hypothetical protein